MDLDLLQADDVDIQAQGGIYVQDKCVERQMVLNGDGYATSPVCLERDVLLQPNMEHIAWGLVENPCLGREAVLNPVCLPPDDVLVAAALVTMEPQVPVRIANFSDKEVKLRVGLLLGDLTEVKPAVVALRQEPQREVDRGSPRRVGHAQLPDPL